MAPESSAGRLVAAVAELLDQLSGSDEDLAVAVADDVSRNVEDPRVRALVARAAIPRRFDAGILEALVADMASEPGDTVSGARLLDAVESMPFTQPHPSGGLRYHDLTRDGLLLRWRSSDHRVEFRRLSATVAAEFERRFERADGLSHEVAIAAETLRTANMARYVEIRHRVDEDIIISFKEAAYHWRNSDPGELRKFLDRYASRLENSRRLSDICLGQVRRALHEVSNVGPDDLDPIEKVWLKYWELRVELSHTSLDTPDAEKRFQQLIAEIEPAAGDAAMSRAYSWLLASYTVYLLEDDRPQEALANCEVELALVPSDKTDDWNRPSVYWRKADIQRRLGDTSAAVSSLRQATDLARDVGNRGLVLALLIAQCDIYLSLGDVDPARRAAGEAIHLVWTLPEELIAEGRPQSDGLAQAQSLANCLVPLLAIDDIRLLDDVVEFRDALDPPGEHDVAALWIRLVQAMWLLKRGAFVRAREVLDEMSSATHSPELERTALGRWHDSLTAMYQRCVGEYGQAEALWARYVVDHAGTGRRMGEHLAIAHHNRAENLADIELYDRALKSAQTAAAMWRAIGAATYARGSEALAARALIGLGRVDEAVSLLDAIDELAGLSSEVVDPYFDAVSLAASAAEDWLQAGEAQRRRAEVARTLGDISTATVAEAAALRAYVRGGQWSELAASAHRITDDSSALQAAVQLSGEDRGNVDSHITATQLFFDGAGDRAYDLRRARDALADSLAQDADNAWLHLASFYIRRAQGSWRDAGWTLRRLQELRPAWLDGHWFSERSAEIDLHAGSVATAEGGSVVTAGGMVRAVVNWLARDLDAPQR